MGKTVWYIKAKPGHTSEVIGKVTSDEDLCYQVKCSDGRKRNLYRCEWGVLEDALGSAENIYLHFDVWRQRGASLPAPFDPQKVFTGNEPPKAQARTWLAKQKARKAAQR